MRRFAKLTRDGNVCYVDPALVGIVALDQKLAIEGNTFSFRTRISDRSGAVLMDLIDQDADEVYRRLAAAGEVVTHRDIVEAETAVDNALTHALNTLAAPGFGTTMLNAYSVQMAVSETLEPFRQAVSKLRRTVLAALWVAEGENPNG